MFVKAIFHVPDDKAEIIRGTDKERERVGGRMGNRYELGERRGGRGEERLN